MWIDDNISMTDGMVMLFEVDGHEVLRAETATLACQFIEADGIDHFSVIIVDVMLTGGENERFARNKTRDYVTTGLVLAEFLVEKYGEPVRKKLFLYTRATQDWVLRAVQDTAKRLSVEWSPRNSHMPPEKFYALIKAKIK